jgi:hypothetical protein
MARPTNLGRLLFTACSLVIEVIPEPGRTPCPAFPQSIFLCSYFVATTERFYAEDARRSASFAMAQVGTLIGWRIPAHHGRWLPGLEEFSRRYQP